MKRLTREQAIVLTGHTGVLLCPLSWFHEDVEKRMKRPVFTHEMGSEQWWKECKQLYANDFSNILPSFEEN